MAGNHPSKKHHRSVNNNPYSSRGLDKFSSVLSELQSKKEKIMSRTSSIAMVRFMYSNSNNWIPVIVRRRSEEEEDGNKAKVDELPPSPPPVTEKAATVMGEMKKRWRWRPSYYMPVVMVLILLCFVISGRVFAICCVAVWWYLVPVLKGDRSGNMVRRVKNRGGG